MTHSPAKTLDAFLGAAENVESVQQQLLLDLLQHNRDCAYGRRYAFSEITSAAAFAKLPYMTYDSVIGFDDFWSDTDNFSADRLSAYFLTSGSSAAPKRIPVTSSLVKQKAAAFAVFWDAIYTSHPALRNGKFIANFGDSGHSVRGKDNKLELSETTFWNQRMQGFQNVDRWPIPRQLTAIKSAELRYYAAARLALQGPLHCLMSLNPSTLVKFCEVIESYPENLGAGLRSGDWGIAALDDDETLPAKLTDRLLQNLQAADRLRDSMKREQGLQLKALWPDLELIICWQSELVGPYLDLLRRYSSGVDFRDYITQSSECIIAIPTVDNTSGGLLAYQSHFYEFIAEADASAKNPVSVPAWRLRDGQQYEVVVTTGGGLYRYRTGDCVRVEGYVGALPRLSFQYRLGRTSSITGEKLTEQQVIAALDNSAIDRLLLRRDVLVFPRTGLRPHYAVLVSDATLLEGSDRQSIARWLQRFHQSLGEANGEYRDKCASLRLGEPRAIITSAEDIAALHSRIRADHVGDEQYKPGVLRRERDLDAGLTILEEVDASS